MTVPPDHGIEGGFGSGLRAKLEAKDAPPPAEPRSPGEAIAAAAVTPSNDPELNNLQAELSASLAREQELRASLSEQVEVSGREVQLEQELAGQAAALDAALPRWRQRRPRWRSASSGCRSGSPSWTVCSRHGRSWRSTESRIAEREQLIELKVHELKTGDEERAAAAAELTEQVENLAAREKEIARAEARIASGQPGGGGASREVDALAGGSGAAAEGTRGAGEVGRRRRPIDRKDSRATARTQFAALERELTQARVQLEAREKVLAARESELSAESGRDTEREEKLAARARELDEREMALTTRGSELAARIEELERDAEKREVAMSDALASSTGWTGARAS